jgi:hypothetical protein
MLRFFAAEMNHTGEYITESEIVIFSIILRFENLFLNRYWQCAQPKRKWDELQLQQQWVMILKVNLWK